MTQEEKARAYDEALEKARKIHNEILNNEIIGFPEQIREIFPQLRESEDERMMREFNDWLCEEIECRTNDLRDEKDRRILNMLCYVLTKVKEWLEKQKQKPAERAEINKSLSDAVIAELSKYSGENHWKSPWAIDSTGLQYPLYFANLGATWQKEQKPAEPSGKLSRQDYLYQLLIDQLITYSDYEYLTEHKSEEWSEEDEKMLEAFLHKLEVCDLLSNKEITWAKHRLKIHPPHWKPNEGQMKWLKDVIETVPMSCRQQLPLESLYNDLLKLMQTIECGM